MSTVQDVDYDDVRVIYYIDDEEVEDGNESTVSHFKIADDLTLNNDTVVSHHASTKSPTAVNNLNSPIVANQDVANSGLAEEQEHFPNPNS